jgi:hypothetical protein
VRRVVVPGLAIKKTTQKNQKKHLKNPPKINFYKLKFEKPTKWVFWFSLGVYQILIFYENNTNFETDFL